MLYTGQNAMNLSLEFKVLKVTTSALFVGIFWIFLLVNNGM